MTTISIRVSDPARVTKTAATFPVRAASIWTRFMCLLQSAWCVVNGGHYKLLYTEPERMALRCAACGHTSPGWAVGKPRLTGRLPANPEQLRAMRPRQVA